MVKTVTPPQLSALVEEIIEEKSKLATVKGETFLGVSSEELMRGLSDRMGGPWVSIKEPRLTLTKEDLNAIANSRFYRKTGIKLLMGMLIIVLGSLLLVKLVTGIPQISAAVTIGLSTMGFLFLYSTKQRQYKKEMLSTVPGHHDSDDGK